MKDGHRILGGNDLVCSISFLIEDPCPLSLPEMLTLTHVYVSAAAPKTFYQFSLVRPLIVGSSGKNGCMPVAELEMLGTHVVAGPQGYLNMALGILLVLGLRPRMNVGSPCLGGLEAWPCRFSSEIQLLQLVSGMIRPSINDSWKHPSGTLQTWHIIHTAGGTTG